MKKLLVVLAALVVPISSQAATKHHRHVQRPHAAYRAQPQIACTDVGCLPVPRGCYPTGGKTWSGLPSGFDVMVCPGGTRYGHL